MSSVARGSTGNKHNSSKLGEAQTQRSFGVRHLLERQSGVFDGVAFCLFLLNLGKGDQ